MCIKTFSAEKVDAATSPIKYKDKLSRNKSSLSRSGKLSVDSCSSGDIVMVVWDENYQNYVILQDSVNLYFLNTDCIETLGLVKKEDEVRVLRIKGQVINKEYCHAKKVLHFTF